MDDFLFRMKIFMNVAICLLIRCRGEKGIKADRAIPDTAVERRIHYGASLLSPGFNKEVNGK